MHTNKDWAAVRAAALLAMAPAVRAAALAAAVKAAADTRTAHHPWFGPRPAPRAR